MWGKRCAYEQKKLSRDKKGLSKSFKKIEKLKYDRDEGCAYMNKRNYQQVIEHFFQKFHWNKDVHVM